PEGPITITEGQSVRLSVSGSARTYSWEPSAGLSITNGTFTEASPVQTTLYTVKGSDDRGCIGADTVRVLVKPIEDIFVPNAFTPNGDGRNDVFKPLIPFRYKLLSFRVYNRWGAELYRSAATGTGWSGSWKGIKQPAGAYVWSLTLRDSRGQSLERKGVFQLIY
ncbi:MAG TPA: gliding motility-associated C-terminal domain-containing protein, partial [Chitinophagaceae bacterium]|nr:gliding motility-associated C-terminal domain-containing protein [Chitinophagaceae bacterium]